MEEPGKNNTLHRWDKNFFMIIAQIMCRLIVVVALVFGNFAIDLLIKCMVYGDRF